MFRFFIASLTIFSGCVDRSDVSPQDSSAGTTASDGQASYIVQDGDTLFGIAKEHYGNGNLWPKIRDANRDVVGKANELSLGQPLILPPLSRIESNASSSLLEATAGTTLPALHEIQPGDTLHGIATRYYGSAEPNAIDRILLENANIVLDVRELPVGATLKIPAKTQ